MPRIFETDQAPSPPKRASKTKKQTPVPTVVPLFHQLALGDASGSMDTFGKYESAKAGVVALRDKAIELGYASFTFIEFAGSTNCFTQMTPVITGKPIKFRGAEGGTPLHRTMTDCLGFINKQAKENPNDFYLFNVYTDGGDTENGRFLEDCKKAIQSAPKNVTITFICTVGDAQFIKIMGVDDSNISTYDNTGDGLTRSIEKTTRSMATYQVRASTGKDVKIGFYDKS